MIEESDEIGDEEAEMERGESEEDEDKTGRGSVIGNVEAERGDEEGKGEMERGESEEDEDKTERGMNMCFTPNTPMEF